MESGSVINAVNLQCCQCDLNFKAEEDLNAHIGDMHITPILPTPEKERAPGQIADLLLTPIHGQKKEEDNIPVIDERQKSPIEKRKRNLKTISPISRGVREI